MPVTVRVNNVPALRGTIYDRNGEVLANDVLEYQAWLDVEFMKRTVSDVELENIIEVISRNFNKSAEETRQKLETTNFMLLGSFETMENLSKKLSPNIRKFVSIEMSTKRLSYSGYGIEKIIGSFKEGQEPTQGIEASYNELLSGKKDGTIKRTLTQTIKKPPENGNDVYLTIDLDIQKMIYQLVEKAVEKHNANGGMALLMESNSGKVVAYANTFPWDTGLMGIFEPGSTIKPVIYGIALKTHSITPETTFTCDGSIKPVENLDIIIRDTEGEKHGVETFRDAIRNSCNVATVQVIQHIVDTIGNQAFYNQLLTMGFGRRTGVDLPGETPGILAKPLYWSLISPYQFGIGQGLGVNIFQLTRALNVYPAKGKLVQPTFVNAVSGTREIRKTEAEVERTPIPQNIVELMIPVLESVVASGTGTRASVDGIRIGGKTGTAQKAVNGAYSDEDYYSLFWGFFPVEGPKYSLLVFIDNPRGEEYYGGSVAGPVFSEIVNNLMFKPANDLTTLNIYKWKMPDLTGYTIHDVIEVAELYNIEDVQIFGTGKVVKQKPEPGTEPDDPLYVWLEE
ncbi:MAG: transpeptidase family protein [Kosmotoga sp.]|nr:MAG: transpeptidase family protein [Kosmotoga sp.]